MNAIGYCVVNILFCSLPTQRNPLAAQMGEPAYIPAAIDPELNVIVITGYPDSEILDRILQVCTGNGSKKIH